MRAIIFWASFLSMIFVSYSQDFISDQIQRDANAFSCAVEGVSGFKLIFKFNAIFQ